MKTNCWSHKLSRDTAGQMLLVWQLSSIMMAWGLSYQRPPPWWTFLLAIVPSVIALFLGHMPLRRTPLDVPLAAFLATAGLGVWAAYDRAGAHAIFPQHMPVGWQALWGLALSVLVFYALAGQDRGPGQHASLAFLATLGTVVSVWFVSGWDWLGKPVDVPLATRLGAEVQGWLPRLLPWELNPNAAGRAIGVCLPMSLGLVVGSRDAGQVRHWFAFVWGLLTAAVMGLALFLTTSRGAWLGLGGASALGALWWLAGQLSWSHGRLKPFLILAGSGAVAAGALLTLLVLMKPGWVAQVFGSRLGLFSEAMLLLRDYPFTGIGLGEFALVHSTYALLIYVPILPFAHCMLLGVALGQGLLGLLAVLAVLGRAAWSGLTALDRAGRPSTVLVAGLLALAIVTLHDMVDDASYSTWAMPLLWVPAGMVVAGWRSVTPGLRSAATRGRTYWCAAAATLAVCALAGLFWRPMLAAWYANLGALYQTRAELGRYDYRRFDNPTLDQIRQQVDLSAAERLFYKALALSPDQVTAHTRLAEIALSRGQYDQALSHAEAAWGAGHRDRVTRLVLGEALVAAGEVDAGVEVVRGVEWAEARFEGQAWYLYWLGGDYRRAANAWHAVVMLNPRNERAASQAQAAEERAGNP